jgi:cell division protein FtsB
MGAESTVIEGSLPTEPRGEPEPPKESPSYRNARLWVQIDGAAHELRETLNDLKTWAAGKLASRPGRGPDPDYDPTDDILRHLAKIIANQRPANQNGDGGEDRIIKRWHLALVAATLMVIIIGSAWRLSEQMSAQFATQSVQISDVREHQREQDDRSTRIEQQLQQLSERRPAGP